MNRRRSFVVPALTRPDHSNCGRSNPVRSAARAWVESLEGRTLLSDVLNPVADTFVRNHVFALTDFGHAPLLMVKNANSGDSRISFLKFDLSGVSSIGHAVLQFTAKLQNSLATPVDTGVYGVTDTSWVEGDGDIVNNIGDGFDTDNVPAGEMTWNNQPIIDSTAISVQTINRDSFQTYSFDVTSYLQAEMNAGQTTVSLALQNLEASPEFVQILSRESSGPGNGPQLVISPTASGVPTAAISAPDVTAAGPSETVTVTYSGGAGIDTSTIGVDDLTISGPSGTLPISGVTFSDNGSAVVAVYTVAAPNGSWSAADNGPYTVSIAAGAVKDLSGAGVGSSLGSFRVAVGDPQPPTAAVSATDITSAGAATYSFNVLYTDNVAIDVSSINIDNVGISGPGGTLKVLSVQTTPSSNASSVTSTYTVAAPNGAWDATDDGTYLITVRSNQVMDTAGNPETPTTGNFAVNIAVPDITPPSATVSAPAISQPGGTSENVTVVYSDNIDVSAASIDTGDITVTGPGGGSLVVSGVTLTPTSDSKSITAVYVVAAPNGVWSASDNGTYTVSVLAGAVTDTSGNAVTAAGGTFNVSAAVADNAPPTAAISAPPINTAGADSQTITVIYSDNVAVDASSLDSSDISVSGPSGPLAVTGVTFSPNGNAAVITATYSVSAPNGGAWDATGNGVYSIAINANQVRDTSGNAVAVTAGSFAVNIPLPNPTDPTFSNGAAVTTPFIAEAILSLPDGQIIVAGHQANGSGSQGVIERLNADGSLDTKFGTNGQIVTPSTSSDAWYSVAQQPPNDFVVAGTHNGDFALARFDFNGNLDPTFGNGGTTFTDFGGTTDIAYSVAVATDGTLVAAGSSNKNFAFVRYDANGHLNSKFGAGGRQVFDTGGTSQVLGAVTVDSLNRVVAAGASDTNLDVVRLTATGDPDTTFNGGGMVVVSGLVARPDGTVPDYTEAVALQQDGKILVANKTTSGHFGVARLNDDGSADTSFGSNGIASANFGGDDDADAIVLQKDTGNILVVGTSLISGTPNTGVAAFAPDGTLIQSFGNSGKVTFDANLAPTSRQLHIGDIFLRAFGAGTAGNKLLLGTSDQGTITTSSVLRRIFVPGTVGSSISETFLGAFGILNGKKTKLVITDVDGTKVTIVLTGGQGSANQIGDGGPDTKIRLDITAGPTGCTLTITTKGGNKRAAFGDIVITGSVKKMTAKTSDISGTLSISGAAGSLSVGNVTGNVIIAGAASSATTGDLSGLLSIGGDVRTIKLGNVSGIVNAAGSIRTISALSLKGAQILAGVALGSDNAVGGLGSAADTYGVGAINSLKVSGAISGAFVGAGVNPVDDLFGNGNDTEAGGALSIIKSINARKGADANTRFEAAAIGSAKLPKKVDPTMDSRFKILS